MNGTFQPSACWAAMRSVTFSPPPPIQIGRRACTGFGSHRALGEREVLAVEVGDVLGEQPAHALDRLVHLAQADRRGRERDAVRVVLVCAATRRRARA